MSVGVISGGKYIKTASNFDFAKMASATQDGLMSKEDYSKLQLVDPEAQGMTVSYEQLITTGTKIGTITINHVDTEIYVPADDDTTYTFVQDGETLKITGSDGSYEEITLGGTITSDAITTALGYTPADEDDIPTTLASLSDDATHRVVTDTEKATWNAKLDSFTETDPTVPSHVKAITSDDITAWSSKADVEDIPSALSELTDDATHRVVTDTEKATWNAKLDSFTETDPTVPSHVKGIKSTDIDAWNAKAETSDIPNVPSWALESTKPTYTASEVGALADTTTHLSGDIASTEKGANNGVATLGNDGKIPESQLPSFVSDIKEYDSKSKFPSSGEDGKIYVAKDTNLTYRWSGSAYVEVSPSIALGETSSTAYAGDKGKANADAISTHTGNTTVHITDAERTAWNAKTSNTGTVTSVEVKMNGATKGTVTTSGTIDLGTVITAHQDISGKVDKITGKGLSTEDYTSAEKTKLAGIAEGATANVGTITGIKMNGASKGTSGVVDLGTVITSHQDISGKQDKLTAGTNITITGNVISAAGEPIPENVVYFDNDSASYASGSSTLTTANIVDSLTSTSSTDVLSAKQGKLLKDAVDTLTALVNGLVDGNEVSF